MPDEVKTYRIRYKYVYPQSTGPFKGETDRRMGWKPKRGEIINAAFGDAIVTSAKELP